MTGGVVRHQNIAWGGGSSDKPVFFRSKKNFGAFGARGCTLYPYGVLGHFWGFPDTNAVHQSQKLAKTEPIWLRNPKKFRLRRKFFLGIPGKTSPMTGGGLAKHRLWPGGWPWLKKKPVPKNLSESQSYASVSPSTWHLKSPLFDYNLSFTPPP